MTKKQKSLLCKFIPGLYQSDCTIGYFEVPKSQNILKKSPSGARRGHLRESIFKISAAGCQGADPPGPP